MYVTLGEKMRCRIHDITSFGEGESCSPNPVLKLESSQGLIKLPQRGF